MREYCTAVLVWFFCFISLFMNAMQLKVSPPAISAPSSPRVKEEDLLLTTYTMLKSSDLSYQAKKEVVNYAQKRIHAAHNQSILSVLGKALESDQITDSPLGQAVIDGNMPAVSFLLDQNEDPNVHRTNHSIPLVSIAMGIPSVDNMAILRQLLQAGADIDDPQWTVVWCHPIMQAARRKDKSMVKLLMKHATAKGFSLDKQYLTQDDPLSIKDYLLARSSQAHDPLEKDHYKAMLHLIETCYEKACNT